MMISPFQYDRTHSPDHPHYHYHHHFGFDVDGQDLDEDRQDLDDDHDDLGDAHDNCSHPFKINSGYHHDDEHQYDHQHH